MEPSLDECLEKLIRSAAKQASRDVEDDAWSQAQTAKLLCEAYQLLLQARNQEKVATQSEALFAKIAEIAEQA